MRVFPLLRELLAVSCWLLAFRYRTLLEYFKHFDTEKSAIKSEFMFIRPPAANSQQPLPRLRFRQLGPLFHCVLQRRLRLGVGGAQLLNFVEILGQAGFF